MKIKKEDLYTYAFSISYIIIFIPKFMNLNYEYSEWNFIYLSIRDVILPAFLFIILPVLGLKSIKKIELYKSLLLGGLSFFIAFLSKDLFVLLMFIFIFFSRNINVIKFFKILFFCFLFLILLYIINFIFSYYITGDAISVFDENFGFRYTFGLYHPNAFPARFFIFVSLYLIVKKKISLLDVVCLFFLNIFVFYYSHSRTSFYLVSILLFLSFFQQYFNLMGIRIIKFLSKISSVIFFALWYILSTQYVNFNNQLFSLNQTLSDRILISFNSLNSLGVSFIPRDIKLYMDHNSFSIDVMYIYSLLSYGLIFSLLYCFCSFILFKIFYKFKLYREIIVLLSIGIYGCLERTMLDVTLNYTLILFSFLLYKNNLSIYIKNKGGVYE